MKTQSTCELQMATYIALLVSCLLVSVISVAADGKITQVETNVGPVQFDAVIELNRYSPHSFRHSYTLLFVRYWVSPDYYRAAVVWAEPQSTDLYFALHPQGLSIKSNEQDFKVCHESNNKHDNTYKKPLDRRGIIRHKFGGYPISNIRYAEQEALAERIYTADIRDLEDANQCTEGALDISIRAPEGGNPREVAQVKLRSNAQRIDSVQLFDAKNQLLKEISYEYEDIGGKSCLRMQTVRLPERPMMVGFNGKGMKVTLDGKQYWYRELEAKHHAGGRTCTVEYEQVRLGDKEVTVPVKVTVSNAKDGKVLRSVRMMNYKQVDLDSAGAEEAARQFCAANADQRLYEELRLKYWKKPPEEIEKADLETIGDLRSRFETTAATAGINLGGRLKYLNILINLNVILGDRGQLERHYRAYLSTLAQNKLDWMTLVGGYGVIETLMFAERHAEAQKLLDPWVDAVLEIHDAESILLFARRQLAKRRLWPTVRMLEALSNRQPCGADPQFEAAALRCMALDGLCKLLRTDDIAKKGLIAQVQAAWVSSLGRAGVDKMFAESVDQAKRSFASLRDPTEAPQILKKQLDKVEQEMSKGEN